MVLPLKKYTPIIVIYIICTALLSFVVTSLIHFDMEEREERRAPRRHYTSRNKAPAPIGGDNVMRGARSLVLKELLVVGCCCGKETKPFLGSNLY